MNYETLKEGGFMRQVQPDHFALRLRVVAGQLSAQQVGKIAELAQQYGAGYVHLTSRQGVEIPFIQLEHIDAVKEELDKVGLEPGACGPRVRTVTACQGKAICPSGLIDTTSVAQQVDRKYFGIRQPHKFKVGITGCTNNCLKAEENDLGIKGGVEPAWNRKECSLCGLCEPVCPSGAIKVKADQDRVELNREACIYCGKCIKSCPTGAWTGEAGYILYFGGTFGNRIITGKKVLPLIKDEHQLFRLIDETLKFFGEQANEGERFGYCLERVGYDALKDQLTGVISNGD